VTAHDAFDSPDGRTYSDPEAAVPPGGGNDAGQAACGHEHEYGGVAYTCERAPHPVDGHEERHRHAARIDAGYAQEIGAKLERDGDDVDAENGTPDLITWEGDEPGDGDNTEVAWGTVEDYGSVTR
jgi:hypothetical protein